MLKTANVVVGANLGDCGKGSLVNYLSNRNTTVVRFCSGSNAGHTVCMPDGRRHIFGHIGSGSFKGANTHLSRFFICNPLLFEKEYKSLGLDLKITMDPRCIITTPFDMIVNQVKELCKKYRHSSCGVGIHESMVRHEKIPINLKSIAVLREQLYHIIDYAYYELGLLNIPPLYEKALKNNKIIDDFLESVKFFNSKISTLYDNDLSGELVFEGAQGLLLDQNSTHFPYVTHAKTGLDNVIEIAKDININDLNVYYVTRPYLTRHGNGPLPNAVLQETFNIIDDTNLPNKWQGKFRFGYLNIDTLNYNISTDFRKLFSTNISGTKNIAISCLDQVPEKFKVINEGKKEFVKINDILNIYKHKILSRSKMGPI